MTDNLVQLSEDVSAAIDPGKGEGEILAQEHRDVLLDAISKLGRYTGFPYVVASTTDQQAAGTLTLGPGDFGNGFKVTLNPVTVDGNNISSLVTELKTGDFFKLKDIQGRSFLFTVQNINTNLNQDISIGLTEVNGNSNYEYLTEETVICIIDFYPVKRQTNTGGGESTGQSTVYNFSQGIIEEPFQGEGEGSPTVKLGGDITQERDINFGPTGRLYLNSADPNYVSTFGSGEIIHRLKTFDAYGDDMELRGRDSLIITPPNTAANQIGYYLSKKDDDNSVEWKKLPDSQIIQQEFTDFTPTLFSVGEADNTYTFTTSTAKYYRVGNLVTVSIEIGGITKTGSGDKNTSIGGLPFPVAFETGFIVAETNGFVTGFDTTYMSAKSLGIDPNSITIIPRGVNSLSTEPLTFAQAGTGAILISGSYLTPFA